MVNQQQFKHENRAKLCYYTNELYDEQDIIKYEMSGRGFGSIYDADTWTLQLHKDIARELENDGILCAIWFDNESMVVEDGYFKEYQMEEEIAQFIETLPIPNQEYIKNSENYLMGCIDRNDWISDKEAQLC